MWYFHSSTLAEHQPTEELFLWFAPDSEAHLLSHGPKGNDWRRGDAVPGPYNFRSAPFIYKVKHGWRLHGICPASVGILWDGAPLPTSFQGHLVGTTRSRFDSGMWSLRGFHNLRKPQVDKIWVARLNLQCLMFFIYSFQFLNSF